MRGRRIRWGNVAKLAAGGVVVVGAIALAPSLLGGSTEPPPLDPDVGLSVTGVSGATGVQGPEPRDKDHKAGHPNRDHKRRERHPPRQHPHDRKPPETQHTDHGGNRPAPPAPTAPSPAPAAPPVAAPAPAPAPAPRPQQPPWYREFGP